MHVHKSFFWSQMLSLGRSQRRFMMKKKPAVQTSLKFKKVEKPCSKAKLSAEASVDQVTTNVPAVGETISTSAITDAISEPSDSSDEKPLTLSVAEAFAALPRCVRTHVLDEAKSKPECGGPDQAFMRLFAGSEPLSWMPYLTQIGVENTDMETALNLIRDITTELRRKKTLCICSHASSS